MLIVTGKNQITKIKVLSIILTMFVLAGIGICGCDSEEEKSTEVVIGSVLPLTGKLSSLGESTKIALELAAENIDAYYAEIGSSVKVKVIYEDTKAEPSVALEKLKILAEKGIKIVIGPDSSAEVEAVKAYAEEKGILLISQASTAPSLAIPGDNLFRFCPDDKQQAKALARLMWEQGARAVIPIWRGDVWGDGLAEATKSSFEELGGKILEGIRYAPNTSDFSGELDSLNSKVNQAIAQYGVNHIAVHLASFEEVVPIFTQAQDYHSLNTVRWYGSDGVALSKVLVDNALAALFAVTTGFINPAYAAQSGPIVDQIRGKINRDPEATALTAYDALWVATKACLATGNGTNSIGDLKKALVQEADQYSGATGWTVLNEAGDRKYGNYDFWDIEKTDDAFQWNRAAQYQAVPGSAERIVYKQKASLSPDLRVLVVHSYHEEWGWDQDIQKGIIEGLSRLGLNEGQDYELKTFYMDTKNTYITPRQIEQRAALALGLIDEFNPDIVFVNDDNALKYVAVEYANKYPSKKLPFVFSGVNADPSVYEPIKSLDNPAGYITGALERFPYYEAFSLSKEISPSGSKVVLLADSSSSSDFVVSRFKLEYLDKVSVSPLQIIGPLQVKTFKEWQDIVTEYQTKADFIGILTYHQLTDENGIVVPAPEVVDWTVQNSTLPEIGILSFHAEDGFFAACGVSGYKTGVYVGVLGGEILQGRDAGSISIVDPGVMEIALNTKRAEMLGIKIPANILAEADEVFFTIGSVRY